MSFQDKGLETTSWSTHDPACNHCRVRKIRCGREHPQCANCIRNGVQCDFSDHGKRVNHMKLLVNNVSGLETRLVNIEKELTRLSGTLRAINGRLPIEASILQGAQEQQVDVRDSWSSSFEPLDQASKHIQNYNIIRNVVPSRDDSRRYHGPCTLLSLCNEFRNSVDQMNKHIHDSDNPQSEEESKRRIKCGSLLNELCISAGAEELLDLNNDNLQVFLPPKQFLLMACSTFFQLEDPVVDIFCQDTFWPNVDRIYSKPYTQTDRAWALCFNTIILLALDAEQPESGGNISSDSVIGSQFAIPFISTIRLALACPEILLLPKLINVQALSLLSVAAQQYLEPGLASIFLAQACLLAKRMGLHQCTERDGDRDSTELDECGKVFRSLFLRDKTNLLSRGIHCWLPSFDCNLSFIKIKTDDGDMTARLHLAHLQEQIYRSVYATESYRQSESSRNSAIEEIEESLEYWTTLHDPPDSPVSYQHMDLKLGFLASRIVALRSSSATRHREQVVKDSRLSCQIIASSADTKEPSVLQTRSPSMDFSSLASFSRTNSSKELQNASSISNRRPSSRLRSLAEGLSVPAFFGLINNVIWPVVGDDIPGDVKLLSTVSQLFQDLDMRSANDNHARKISRAFQTLLSIAQLLRPELFLHNSQHSGKASSLSSNGSNAISSSFPNNSSAILISSAALSGSHSSAYSTTCTTRTNTPPFDLLQPLDFSNDASQYDMVQQFSSSPDHVSKRQCLVVPTAVSSDDLLSQHLFSYFPEMSPLMSLSGEKQDGTNGGGF